MEKEIIEVDPGLPVNGNWQCDWHICWRLRNHFKSFLILNFLIPSFGQDLQDKLDLLRFFKGGLVESNIPCFGY